MGVVDYIVLFLYFAVMVVIGIWSMRRVKGQEDYFMGGRGFGKLLQTFAAFGAGTGAHEPGTVGSKGWTSGLSGVWSALMWLFVTPIYWIIAVWYRRMRHLTLGDWFVERYESRPMGAAYAIFAIVFYMQYLSTMFTAVAAFAVPLLGVESIGGVDVTTIFVPLIAVMVIIYGVLGGLTAAYWTDLIQGVFIILLSVLLIPFGLWALVKEFGDPATMGVMDGFSIMHDRVSPDYFNLFSGPSAGEFPVQYIVSLTLLVLVGIVVQPHFIATGGGSAKSEDEARIGLVVGNFLKRLCTVGWAITALIALALLAGNAEIAQNPDYVWGVASREILGPLKFGLVGLMLACLIAALMSSADCYMIVTSALVVRNIYAPYVNPNASEKKYVLVGRITGLIIIVGAAIYALVMSDLFGQFKMAVELPILFAAPFWVGMMWRRVNTRAVWITMTFSFLFFFVLPVLLPKIMPGLRSSQGLAAQTLVTTKTFSRPATAADVAKREGWEEATEDAKEKYSGDTEKMNSVLAKIGAAPPVAVLGEPIELTLRSGGNAIFWRDGLDPVEGSGLEEVERREEDGMDILVQRQTGEMVGKGALKIDFLIYHWMGIDLSTASKATLETLRLPPRVLLPFLILIVASFFTKRNSKEALDRYYAKMRTEVDPDPEKDTEKLAASYASPEDIPGGRKKLFPGTDLELLKPRPKDILGFLAACAACVVIIQLLVWLANIGA
ncbi:MAG: sodium:solute symporter family protein [Verrucomicrobiales bacterium]|nr:sodium:solute symporter family protein [Verrucomicrobiales bacterium]